VVENEEEKGICVQRRYLGEAKVGEEAKVGGEAKVKRRENFKNVCIL
jgi:hypothetical protein